MRDSDGYIGIAYACASALKTAYSEPANESSASIKILSAVGLVLSLCFVVLLLVPGLPGCLNGPGYAMLGVWIAMGIVFYTLRVQKIK